MDEITNENLPISITLEEKKEVARNLGIFELRSLGRELGVPSPTTLNRAELLAQVIKKIDQGVTVDTSAQKKGRPYKKLSNLDNLLRVISAPTKPEPRSARSKDSEEIEKIVAFAQETPAYMNVSFEQRDFRGVLRKKDDACYLNNLTGGDPVFFDDQMIDQYKLENGDFVEGVAVKVNPKNQYSAQKLTSINFEDPLTPPRAVRSSRVVISRETLPFASTHYYVGRRNLVKLSGNVFETSDFEDMVRYNGKNGIVTIVVGMGVSFEDNILFSQTEGVINLSTMCNHDPKTAVEKMLDAYSLANKLLALGKKVVVFVDDIIATMDQINMLFSNVSSDKYQQETLIIMQKILMLGCAKEDGSSVTMLITFRDFDSEHDYIKSSLRKICTMI